VPELPIAERDPGARVRAAAHALREAPRLSWELVAKVGEWAPPLLAGFVRRQLGERMANLALTPSRRRSRCICSERACSRWCRCCRCRPARPCAWH
jgi:hypothetical protein